MQNLSNIINNRETQDELKLIFNEEYYNIATLSNNDFSVQKNLVFYSEKGTTFDFQNTYTSAFVFNFKSDSSCVKIKFYNITFYNFNDEDSSISLNLFYIPVNHNKFKIEFNNCKFIQNKGLLLNFIYNSTKAIQSTPQVILNDCSFM